MNLHLPLSWPEKYRPRTFEQVVGQRAALTRIKALVQHSRHLILSGPSGSGKTTIASLYAKALMCRSTRDTASACGTCEACRSIDAGHNHHLYRRSPSELGAASVRELMSAAEATVLYAARHIVMVNEAQQLTDGAIDAFLDPMEKETAPRTVIFTLINADDLPEPLRTRCQEIRLQAPTVEEKLSFLGRIVAGEQLEVDQEALELLSHFGRGYRGLARDLQALAEASSESRITTDLVRSTILRDRAEGMLAYLSAAASGNWPGQERAMEPMNLAPGEKVQALLDVLLHLKLRYVGPAISHDRRFELLLPQVDCRRLLQLFEAAAQRHGLDLTSLFDEVLEYWTFLPARLDAQNLRSQLVRFHDLLNLERSDPNTSSVEELIAERSYRSTAAARPKPQHRRRLAGQLDPASYLSETQAKDLYEGASFLVQKYGVHFNSWVRLTFATEAAMDASKVPGQLSKDLRRRLSSWSGADSATGCDLHRLILTERDSDGHLVSTMLFHANPELVGRIENWIGIYLTELQRKAPSLLAVDRDIKAPAGDKANTRQWALMKNLWRGVDPTIMVDGEPLVERLGIWPAHRRPAGQVPSGRRYNFSQSLTQDAREREARLGLPGLSAWADDAWSWLFKGWEAREHKDRLREASRRERQVSQLEAERQAASDSLHRSQLQALIEQEINGWPSVRERVRSATLWW